MVYFFIFTIFDYIFLMYLIQKHNGICKNSSIFFRKNVNQNIANGFIDHLNGFLSDKYWIILISPRNCCGICISRYIYCILETRKVHRKDINHYYIFDINLQFLSVLL